MTGIIVGFGRAGKRHGKMLDELGIKWVFYDPNLSMDRLGNGVVQIVSPEFEVLIRRIKYDFAVIATPPNLHLAQIQQCLDAGLPVLCEKPLCGLGQLGEAEALLGHPNAGKVMVAYNWRFHPGLRQAKGKIQRQNLVMFAEQDRQLPDWGLLLDHCSHDLDIMRFLVGDFKIDRAEYLKLGQVERWIIEGEKVYIADQIRIGAERYAKIHTGSIDIDLDPDPAMYTAMWAAFLSGQYAPGLRDAIETQRLLERCEELAR